MQLSAIIGTGAAADLLGVSRDTVRRWARDGRIEHIVLPSGQLKFHRASIAALLEPVGSAPSAASPSRPVG